MQISFHMNPAFVRVPRADKKVYIYKLNIYYVLIFIIKSEFRASYSATNLYVHYIKSQRRSSPGIHKLLFEKKINFRYQAIFDPLAHTKLTDQNVFHLLGQQQVNFSKQTCLRLRIGNLKFTKFSSCFSFTNMLHNR